MFELNGNENLVYTLITMLIMSLMTNLVYINKDLYNKVKNRKKANGDALGIIPFFENQISSTRTNEGKFFHKHAKTLRSAYLHIERRGLTYEIDSDEYKNFVNDKAMNLYNLFAQRSNYNHIIEDIKKKIKIISLIANKTEDGETKASIEKCLDRCREAYTDHAHQGKGLQSANRSLTKIIMGIANKNNKLFNYRDEIHGTFIKNSRSALDKFSENNQLIEPISEVNETKNKDKIAKHNADIHEGIHRCKQIMNKAEREIDEARDQAAIAYGDSIEPHQEKLTSISESLFEESTHEIDRLKNVIQDQRNIIRDLEDHQLATESNEGKNSNEIAESLERELKDADTCIKTLENELYSLRLSMKLNEPESEPENDAKARTAAYLTNTVNEMEEQLESLTSESNQDKVIVQFLNEVVEASGAEDLSLLIYQTVCDLGYRPDLVFFTENRTIDVSSSKSFTKQRKIAVINMTPGETSTSNNKRELNFRLSHFAGLVHHNVDTPLSHQQTSKLFTFLTSADKMLGKLKAIQSAKTQGKKIGEFANAVKILVSDIDNIIEKDLKQLNTSIASHFDRTKKLMKSRGLNDSIVASLRNTELEVINEMESNINPRSKIRRAALRTLQKLE